MPLEAGTKLGPYEILSPLGAGGMGEVYRARDTRLERNVAIKILPTHLCDDPSLKQRLEREAKAVSKLSHPNICALHDIGQHELISYIVMELVEGETLEQRLTRGALPSEQILRYGPQIADALSKAHKLGFVHRDLKPANIMLTKSGAKLMDFGLAKQSGPAPLAGVLTEMTAEQTKLTGEGTVVGTFQYMAPEQLEGKEADPRTDIFAFGEVLYEMATGKPAFTGKSRASLIASILTAEPPSISQLQPMAPAQLERVVQKCLAKDPDDRWQSASDLASELKWIAETKSQSAAQAQTVKMGRRRWVLPAFAILTACSLGAAAFGYLRQNTSPRRVIRAVIPAEEGTSPLFTGDFAGPAVISPDANALAFVASPESGMPLLFVRKLNDLHAVALHGTDGATFPFWSPDSRSLGFFQGGKLKTISADGGTPFVVCDAPTPRGGTWGSKGLIVFAPSYLGSLNKVAATGGNPSPVTELDKSLHDSHRWPRFLPDGKHFVFLAVKHTGAFDANNGTYFGTTENKETHLVLRGHTEAVFAGGRLLFERDGALMAQPFNPRTGALQGDTVHLADNVLHDSTTWNAAFDASGQELLAYSTGGVIPAQAMWYDRNGKELGPAGSKVFNLNSVRLSPDETKVATESGETNSDIWIYDVKRNVNTRLTYGAGASSSPVWSPDGKWIAYIGVRSSPNTSSSTNNAIFRKSANGGGEEELLLEGDNKNRVLADWSPDGKTLLFMIGDIVATGQIWTLSTSEPRKPIPLIQGNFIASAPRFSPDGHWIAYTSNESGRNEVYVIPFGGGTGKWQISNTGGSAPVWRRDEKELYYWSADNALVAVSVSLRPGVVEVGESRVLARWNSPVGNIGIASAVDVTKDGQKFIAVSVGQQPARTITVMTNWTGN